MTNPMPQGLTPYLSPVTLSNAPTGVDFTTIPATTVFDPAANNSELWNLCARATSMADQYCNQLLRATVDREVVRGPDFYLTVGPSAGGGLPTPYWADSGGNARAIMSRWPILAVNQVRVSASAVWPRQWQTVPTGYAEPEFPPFGIYNSAAPGDDAYGGQGVLVAPGYISRAYGRNGFMMEVTYTNGWPHTSLTAAATAGSTVVSVTDTTGWAISNYDGSVTGATGVFKDGGQQETGSVSTASTTSGAGTLTLSSPLAYPHETGTVFTTLPAAIEQACILFCCAQALVRGATSTTIHAIGGHAQGSDKDITQMTAEAEALLSPFKRTI